MNSKVFITHSKSAALIGNDFNCRSDFSNGKFLSRVVCLKHLVQYVISVQ